MSSTPLAPASAVAVPSTQVAPPDPAAAAAQPAAAQSRLAIEVSGAGEEKAKLQAIVATIDQMFATPELWRDFATVAAQYPQIFVGPDYQQQGLPRGMADPAGAAGLLRNSTNSYHFFSAILGVTGTYYKQGPDYAGTCTNPNKSDDTISCRGTGIRQNYSNNLVVTHGIGMVLADAHELVSIEIGREVFDRYNSSSKLKRSCTYNTLAHEWTHTIGKNQERHVTIVVDSDEKVPKSAVKLSHLFGSVVQCSWLRSQGEIGLKNDDKALKACVTNFGADQFLSSKCQ